MIARGPDQLEAAWRHGGALVGFTAYNLETALAIAQAGEEAGVPVLLQTGAASLRGPSGDALARVVVAVAETAPNPVGVHLDHSRDVGEVRRCIELGYSSVMYDGSDLPFEENVALTREVVELAKPSGVWVEGELGPIAGDEDRSTGAAAGAYTDPDEARRFAELTGVDALAVAVGNVHGIAAEPATLDLERLALIRDACPIPLVLHGASGVPRETLRRALGCGVAKVNVNTELRRAFLAGLRAALAEAGGDDVVSPMAVAQARVREVAREIAAALAPSEQPVTTVAEARG